MTRTICPYLLLVLATILLMCCPSLAQNEGIDCADLASKVLKRPDLLESNVLPITQSPSCFFEANNGSTRPITPLRVSIWDAVESLSAGQQQGSSLSSSGSTNAVSKPSGPTALAQEFGGADVAKGTSSTTVQWSPGKMLANLALTGAESLCLTDKPPKVPQGCVSSELITDLTPLVFKITANTSSGTPSVAGTATNPMSTTQAQQVNVASQGASGPSFSGFTVQYSLPGSRSQTAVKSLTTPAVMPAGQQGGSGKDASAKQGQKGAKAAVDYTYYDKELDEMWAASQALDKCDVYKTWGPQAEEKLKAVIATDKGDDTKTDDVRKEELKKEIENQYSALFTTMQASKSCDDAVRHLRTFYETILEAKTYDLLQAGVTKPEYAFEYDLNTPQNKPSYSSVKATVNWQFGKSTAKTPTDDETKFSAPQKAVREFAREEANKIGDKSPSLTASTAKQGSTQAKQLAKDTAPPLSITITGTADIYNSEPSSSIPSASHLRDIQAGAEIAYVSSPFGKTSVLGKSLGALTLAAAYSYEDQTSPAILTGPALTDFTGLPSSTTAAYAKRGVIHLGQVRLGFGTGKNLTFPLAFTYSNRTELITHPTWGLQFGITYNLTSLFNSSGTAKSQGSN
jgi:hypothetical protein